MLETRSWIADGLSDALLRQAFAAAQVALCVVDRRADDMPIVFVNSAFEQLTGYAAEEAIGRNCRFLQAQDRSQPALRDIAAALRHVRDCRAVLRNYRNDGSAFLNELRLSPIRDAAGTVSHFVGCQSELPFASLALLRDEAVQRLDRLSERERDMLARVVAGESTKAAARALGISPRTAEKHRQSLLRKMQVGSIAELVSYAMAGESVSRPPPTGV